MGKYFAMVSLFLIGLLAVVPWVQGVASGAPDNSVWSGRYPSEIWSNRSRCANNLKQLGLSLKIYSSKSGSGKFPPLSPDSGRLMFDDLHVTNEFLPNDEVLVCPGVADPQPALLCDDTYYVYPGYLLWRMPMSSHSRMPTRTTLEKASGLTTTFWDTAAFNLKDGITRSCLDSRMELRDS